MVRPPASRRRDLRIGRLAALLIVTALVLSAQGAQGARAAAPSDTVEFAFWQSGSSLTVTEVLVGKPGDRAGLLPGATGVLVPAGQIAALKGDSLAIPSGDSRAEVQYSVPFPTAGISVLVPVFTPTKTCFVLAGEGVAFPVILNQAFYKQGASEALGHNFTVYAAKGFSAPFRLNIERAQLGGGFDLEWLWLAPAISIAAYLLVRLRRRHA